MARVDIVIPLYNKARCIGRAIRSILNQTVSDWRLIVVDDGSTDGGGEIVQTFDDGRIEMIRQENAGPGAARNAGIARATSKYIAFLDADDEWLPFYLENSLQAIESHNVGLVACMFYESLFRADMTSYWAKRGVQIGRQYAIDPHTDPVQADWIVSFLHTDAALMHTHIARRYGGFYDKDRCTCGEDTVLFMRIAINESYFAVGPTGVIHHREDSGLSHTVEHPLPPFLQDPNIILDYCPGEKKELVSRVIDHMALRHAQIRARHGRKAEAISLLGRFAGASAFGREYRLCRRTIAVSRWMPLWVRLKCFGGACMRRFRRTRPTC
ncbi:MAG: glycosyltransferase family 2 protein [Phycisphaerae bacterium]|nr:glycosyltransferase family 2 protein [Phycisphaerae bacterium]